MTTDFLMNDEELEQVTGGNKAYVYVHDNGHGLSCNAFICERPLTAAEIEILRQGGKPDTGPAGWLCKGIKKGKDADSIVAQLQKDYTEIKWDLY